MFINYFLNLKAQVLREGVAADDAVPHQHVRLGSFTSQDFGVSPRSSCADLSSPQISAILVGHFTWENYRLHNSPETCAEIYETPCSRNSLRSPRWRRAGAGSSRGPCRCTPHPGRRRAPCLAAAAAKTYKQRQTDNLYVHVRLLRSYSYSFD